MNPLRIGTRGSPLALWQAHYVSGLLRAAAPDVALELVEIQTVGDQVRDVPLAQLGGDGAFTKAIQQALQENRVAIAVHSLKDLPTFAVANLLLAAVPPRGSVGDAFIAKKYRSFSELPQGAVVASSSQRRRAQVLHRRPDLKLVDIRGNVETRLRKLAASDLDGIILAQAGLERLGLEKHITELLDPSWMLPAVGQGALGLECRCDDAWTRGLLEKIDDPTTHAAVLAERALLRGLGGGCQVPIGALSSVRGDWLTLRGAVLTPDGRERVEGEITRPLAEAETMGQMLAQNLLSQGARRILDVRFNFHPETLP
jgi:hydroxymethylbilane synthase